MDNKQTIQAQIQSLCSNYIRHEGNVLELSKQVKQTQAELDYEQDQMMICQLEMSKLQEVLKTIL